MKRFLLFGAALGVLLSVVACGNPGKAPCTPFTCYPSPSQSQSQPNNALLQVLITPTGDGTVAVSAANQSPTTCTTNCTLPFPSGSGPITLTATANSGNGFVSWTNCVDVSGPQCTITTLNADLTVTATFQ